MLSIVDRFLKLLYSSFYSSWSHLGTKLIPSISASPDFGHVFMLMISLFLMTMHVPAVPPSLPKLSPFLVRRAERLTIREMKDLVLVDGIQPQFANF